MLKSLEQLISSPDIAGRDERTTGQMLRIILTIASLASIVAIPVLLLLGGSPQALSATILLALFLLAIYLLLWRGALLPAKVLLPFALYLTFSFLIATGGGLHDISVIAYAGVIIVASLTLGQNVMFVFAGLIILTVFGIGIAEMLGGLTTSAVQSPGLDDPIIISIIVLAIALIQRAVINRLNENIRRARENEQAQIEANQELRKLQASLEKNIAERTSDLAAAKRHSEQRLAKMLTVSEVARSITSLKGLPELLPSIVDLISERFGFYHVGIFLNDSANQYAVLSAANKNSLGGQRMLARRHQLKVGEQGIIGYVTATGKSRVALNVGDDSVFFRNPDLASTRSEMALPLTIGETIIGALDVQSTEPNAFTSEDVETLSTLADQVSLAIQNARLFEQTRKSLNEAESLYRQSVREAWVRLPQEDNLVGFRYTSSGVEPLDDQEATQNGNGKRPKEKRTAMLQRPQVEVPITLRGEQIGILKVVAPEAGRLKSDQLDMIRAVAERVALAAENARLFEETTRRAQRERLVSDITTKIRSTNDPQEMIRTAIEELRQALGASRVEVVPQSNVPKTDS
ncbi:MAG: hypothetical protein A2Z03_05270 [Chloroflexi bacterium RBG_16_56_8]|nr:MAG: hypothetical protein A2Z03_05270 [Chloroflexi bacterium RBG_16_56_8]